MIAGLLALVTVGLYVTPALAHHSFAMYDQTKTVTLTGADPANRVVLLQFPNMDAVKAWNAKEAPFERSVGDKYATFNTFAIEGATP